MKKLKSVNASFKSCLAEESSTISQTEDKEFKHSRDVLLFIKKSCSDNKAKTFKRDEQNIMKVQNFSR